MESTVGYVNFNAASESGSTVNNSLLKEIQNIFAIVYIIVYFCTLVATSIYALYIENACEDEFIFSNIVDGSTNTNTISKQNSIAFEDIDIKIGTKLKLKDKDSGITSQANTFNNTTSHDHLKTPITYETETKSGINQ